MKSKITSKNIYKYLLMTFIGTLLYGCGGYQSIYNDGIYGEVPEKRVIFDDEEYSEYEENYFTKELERLNDEQGTDIFTDIENYKSINRDYNQNDDEEVYQENSPWGYNDGSNDIVININNDPNFFWNDFGWGPLPWVNARWGAFGWNHVTWSGFGWNRWQRWNRWGWNRGGFFRPWGPGFFDPNWGPNWGYFDPYWGFNNGWGNFGYPIYGRSYAGTNNYRYGRRTSYPTTLNSYSRRSSSYVNNSSDRISSRRNSSTIRRNSRNYDENSRTRRSSNTRRSSSSSTRRSSSSTRRSSSSTRSSNRSSTRSSSGSSRRSSGSRSSGGGTRRGN